jgi:hypothetical protein
MQTSNVFLMLVGFGALALSGLASRLAPRIAGFFAYLEAAYRARAMRPRYVTRVGRAGAGAVAVNPESAPCGCG